MDTNAESEKSYWAFVSYSSKDRKWGQWLHHRLENYPIPREFQGTEIFDGAVLGRNLRPCFRDRDELSGSAQLGPAIDKALRNTRFLVVLCSPQSACSEWVNKEIVDFRAMHGSKRILALILQGEPNATSNPGVADELECFPPALRYPEEPLAGDLRKEGDGKERGFLKILAGIAQLDFDGLYRRHERAARKKRLTLAAVAVVVILGLVALSLFAFQQKEEAQRQEGLATKKEEEARFERDQARKTLARFYAERALIADDPDKSLAWLQKACEIDPTTLQQPQLVRRAIDWIAPWPGPDFCLSTRPSGGDGSWMNTPGFLSNGGRRRFVSQTGPNHWDLIDWAAREVLGSFVFPEEIMSIEECGSDEFFAVRGRGHAELRAWSDGRLIHRLPGEYSRVALAVTSTEIFLTAYDYPAKTTRLLHLGKSDPSGEATVIAEIEGSVDAVEADSLGGVDTVAVLRRKENAAQPDLLAWRRGSGSSSWQPLPIALPAGSLPVGLREFYPIPEGWLQVYQSDPNPLLLIDLQSLQIHQVSEEEKTYSLALVTIDGAPRRLVGRYDANGNSRRLVAEGLSGEPEIALLGGRIVRELCYCPKGQAVAGWDEEKGELVYQAFGEASRTMPLERPIDWPAFMVHEVTELDEGLLLIEAIYPFSARTVWVVADLAREGDAVFHFGTAPGFDSCLALVRLEDGFAATALTHKRGAISYYDRLLPLEEWKKQSRTRTLKCPEDIAMLDIDEEGRPSMLVRRREGSDNQVATFPPAEGLGLNWLPTTWSGAEGSLFESVQRVESGHFLLRSYGEAQVISPAGALLWAGNPEGIMVIGEGKDERLLRAENGQLLLSDLSARDLVWTVPFPQGPVGMKTLPNGGAALLSTAEDSGFGGEEKKFRMEMSVVDLAAGARETAVFEVRGEDAAGFIGFGHEFALLGGDVPRVIHTARSNNGIVTCGLFEAEGEELREALRWNFSMASYTPIWTPLPDGSFLALWSDEGGGLAKLCHFQRGSGGWEGLPLAIPEGFDRVFSNREGSRCVVGSRDRALLYDLGARRQVGGYLKLPGEYDTVGQSDEIVWSSAGHGFFLVDDRSVHEFDGETGLRLRELGAHQRQRTGELDPMIESFVLSPGGQWFASCDSLGGVVTTGLANEVLGLEDLRDLARRTGGYEVINDDDLVPWQAPPFLSSP
jgi:hypothetical protein